MIRPMRFLQTSDWQLGLSLRHLGEKAPRARELRLDAAQRAMDVAREQDVDFVLVAGDTFDTHEVDNLVVEKAVEVLSSAGDRPVFVLPGNHDPLRAGGVWGRRVWHRRPENVVLLDESVEVLLPSGDVLYPCPLTQKQSRRDPTAWIPPRESGDSRLRVAVAHGSLGVAPKAANFPIAADRCAVSGLDHLALGDWHGLRLIGRCAYSGTVEATSFSEQDPGFVLVVTIDGQSRDAQIATFEVGGLRWSERNFTVRAEADLAALRRVFADLREPDQAVLRTLVRVDAEPAGPLLEELEDLRRLIAERVFAMDWRVEVTESWVDELPRGVGRSLDEGLALLAAGAEPPAPLASFSGLSPDVAARARSLLRRLAAQSAPGGVDAH